MKISIKRAVLAFFLVHSVTYSKTGNEPLGPNQISITNATDMPLVLRAVRRESHAARWHEIKDDDRLFELAGPTGVTLAERSAMTEPFTLKPGQTRRMLWLKSWTLDLLFAPQGSDLAERISQTPCTVDKGQVVRGLERGYWGNVTRGTCIILYYIPSDTAKRQLLRSDAKQFMGERAGQQTVATGKINMAVIPVVQKRLTPDQAADEEAKFINTVRVETGV